MSPRAGSLSNEPLAVPGESISSDSFLSSSQVGFPLQDWGRARKGSVALVDDRRRCNCVCVRVRVCVCVFYHFGANVFQSFSMELQKHPSIHIAFRSFSKNEFAVLDTKRLPPPKREFTQISAITRLASRPSRAGGQLLFRPQRTVTPSPAPALRQSADPSPPPLQLPFSASSPSQRLPGPFARSRSTDLGPAGPLDLKEIRERARVSSW